jgi:hypothetical protein
MKLSLVRCSCTGCPNPVVAKWHPSKNPESLFWICESHLDLLTKTVYEFKVIDGEYYSVAESSQ